MAETTGGIAPAVLALAQVGAQVYSSRQQSQQGQQGQQGQQNQPSQSASSQAIRSWDESTRRQETAIRGPPPKEAVSMVKYIVIAVIIIAVLLIYYGVGRAWVQPPEYKSVFNSFTPDRMVIPPERRPMREMVSDSTRVFGIMPRPRTMQ